MKFHLIASEPSSALLLTLEVREERMRVWTVDLDLAEERKGDVVLARAELLDLFVGAGLLLPELIARETEHDEPLVLVLPVEALESRILRREPALAGDVHDEQRLGRGKTSSETGVPSIEVAAKS